MPVLFSGQLARRAERRRRSTPPKVLVFLTITHQLAWRQEWWGWELEAKGDPSGAQRVSVAVMRVRKWDGGGGCRGWGGLGGRGSEIRFTKADGYRRGTRLPADLSAEGVSKTFCQRHSDVSVRHTRLGVCRPHPRPPHQPERVITWPQFVRPSAMIREERRPARRKTITPR